MKALCARKVYEIPHRDYSTTMQGQHSTGYIHFYHGAAAGPRLDPGMDDSTL